MSCLCVRERIQEVATRIKVGQAEPSSGRILRVRIGFKCLLLQTRRLEYCGVSLWVIRGPEVWMCAAFGSSSSS